MGTEKPGNFTFFCVAHEVFYAVNIASLARARVLLGIIKNNLRKSSTCGIMGFLNHCYGIIIFCRCCSQGREWLGAGLALPWGARSVRKPQNMAQKRPPNLRCSSPAAPGIPFPKHFCGSMKQTPEPSSPLRGFRHLD